MLQEYGNDMRKYSMVDDTKKLTASIYVWK